jgi:hypothetical protein
MNLVHLAGVLREPVFQETSRGRFSGTALLDFGDHYGFKVRFFCLNATAQKLQTFSEGQELALSGRLVMSKEGNVQILADTVEQHNARNRRTSILNSRNAIRYF